MRHEMRTSRAGLEYLLLSAMHGEIKANIYATFIRIFICFFFRIVSDVAETQLNQPLHISAVRLEFEIRFRSADLPFIQTHATATYVTPDGHGAWPLEK